MPDVTAALDFPPDDPDAEPHARITAIARSLGGMLAAGELDALPDDTRRIMDELPLCLIGIAGDVRMRLHGRMVAGRDKGNVVWLERAR